MASITTSGGFKRATEVTQNTCTDDPKVCQYVGVEIHVVECKKFNVVVDTSTLCYIAQIRWS